MNRDTRANEQTPIDPLWTTIISRSRRRTRRIHFGHLHSMGGVCLCLEVTEAGSQGVSPHASSGVEEEEDGTCEL